MRRVGHRVFRARTFVTAVPTMSGGTGGFQRLVRLVARLFYAEEVPPPEVPLDDMPAPRRSKTPQACSRSQSVNQCC